MFKIYDGRNQFYQWDLNRKLIVEEKSINEVHFCNRTDSCSLVCQVYDEDGLRLVDVPNVLLQQDWRINVYGYDKDYTKFSAMFNVVKRSKPEDYVYTEDEIKSWEQLEERVEQIEENGVSDEQISTAVNNYLEENPIEVDLTGYATETYVDEQLKDVKVDLSDYYTKTETDEAIEAAIEDINIPTGGSAEEIYVGDAVPEDSEALIWINPNGESSENLATKGYVDAAIEAIELTPGPQGEKGDKGETGAQGPIGETGPQGEPGADYVLTETDKTDIAELVIELLPNAEEASV